MSIIVKCYLCGIIGAMSMAISYIWDISGIISGLIAGLLWCVIAKAIPDD